MSAEIARLGGLVGGCGLALLIVSARRDLRVAGLVAWAAGALMLVQYLAPSGHHRVLAAAAVVGALAAAAGAWALVRWPWALAFAALACAPARIPVHVGSTKANLLLPLYGVVAAAALALAWQLPREEGRSRELGRLAWPLALFSTWLGASLLWSHDLHQGAIDVLFFHLPFGLLAVCVARLAWDRRMLVALYAQLTAMAVVFAAIGVYQYSVRDIFWNPKVIVDNAYAPSSWFYRVNSVFYDPSIYGRFLVVAILASLVVVMRERAWRIVAGATVALAVVWIGLLPSFSQSSFAALIVGVLVAAAISWRWRAAAALGVAAGVVVVAGFAAPQVRHTILGKSGSGLSKATGGRSKLVSNGLRVALDHPVAGVGVGGFRRAYADRAGLRGREPKAAASHNTPITVAAETGVPGLALLAWLLAAALLATLRSPFVARAGLVFGLAITAIAVHSLFYNALFEDPMFWGLLGLAAVGARAAALE